jgi:hypothetical protein
MEIIEGEFIYIRPKQEQLWKNATTGPWQESNLGPWGPSIPLYWNRRAASFTPGPIVAFFVAVPG